MELYGTRFAKKLQVFCYLLEAIHDVKIKIQIRSKIQSKTYSTGTSL
jgi:hypothetical protein